MCVLGVVCVRCVCVWVSVLGVVCVGYSVCWVLGVVCVGCSVHEVCVCDGCSACSVSVYYYLVFYLLTDQFAVYGGMYSEEVLCKATLLTVTYFTWQHPTCFTLMIPVGEAWGSAGSSNIAPVLHPYHTRITLV